jgi:hypothetical protein
MTTASNLKHRLSAAALLAAVCLAGCSALQVDVDVYKGALINDREVQVRQFAAMVIAAKPVLVHVRNTMQFESDKKTVTQVEANLSEACTEKRNELVRKRLTPSAAPALSTTRQESQLGQEVKLEAMGEERFKYAYRFEFSDRAAFFLNGLLSLYEPLECVNTKEDWHRARDKDGLIDLFGDLTRADQMAPGPQRDTAVETAVVALTRVLIPFAERILFVVNNSDFFKGRDNIPEVAILQTLGNSLMLHANDLRRREVHDQNQRQRFDAQRRAAADATAANAPAAVLQHIGSTLKDQQTQAATRLTQAQAAATAARAAADTASLAAAAANTKAAEAKAAVESWRPDKKQLALALAFATLVDPNAASDLPAAQQDQAALTAAAKALKPNANTTARKVANALRSWASSRVKASAAPSDPSARQQRLAALVQVFDADEPLLRLQPIADGPAANVLEMVKLSLTAAYREAQLPLIALKAKAAQVEKQAEAPAKAKQQALAAHQLAETEVTRAQAKATDTANTFKLVIDALPQAVAAIDSTTNSHPEVLRQALVARLAPAANASEDTRKQLAVAANTIRDLVLPTGFAFDDKTYGNQTADKPRRTSLQVLDDLIAHYRTQRIAALARGDGTQARQLAEAVEAAEQQRSDQIFLRPSSDYLRDVFASTVLQADSTEPNRNMLLDYLRTLKFGPDTEDDIVKKARRDLEKLFWQNINRVTTTGGTNANHVIAKDDVGNWTIKAYSTDPKQVFESAKGLALFNKGAKLDSNLLRRAQLRDDERNGSDDQKAAATKALSTMDTQSPANMAVGGRAQQRFEKRYKDETLDIAGGLAKRIGDMPEGNLRSGWAALLKASDADEQALLERLVKVASKRQDDSVRISLDNLANQSKNVVNNNEHPSRLGAAVVDVLSKMLGYRNDMHAAIAADAYLADSTRAPLRDQLQKASKASFNELIDDVAQQRLRSVDTYKEGLASIVDVVK